jgi:hypothetical protein
MVGGPWFFPMKISRTEKVVSEIDPSVVFHLKPWNERRRTKTSALAIEASQAVEDLAREELGIDRKHLIPVEIEDSKEHLKDLTADEIREREEALIEADPSYKSADLRDLRLLHISREVAIAKLSAEAYRERGRERARVLAQMQAINHESLRPVWLHAGLTRVEGAEDEDGNELSIDDFIELAPQALVDEAYILILKRAQLNGDEAKNSDSPSTSGAAEVGEKTDSTAPSAS